MLMDRALLVIYGCTCTRGCTAPEAPMCCREDAAPAVPEAGAPPPVIVPGLGEGQPSTAVEAARDVNEAELGVTQMMEQAGRRSDALANLEASLRPIERYAVRIVEEVRGGVRFGSTPKVLANHMLKYYRISDCMAAFTPNAHCYA